MWTELFQRMTPFDRKLILLVGLAIGVSFSHPFGQKEGSRVVVQSDDGVVFVAPLDQTREVTLNGPLGETILKISDGAARVISSPCPQKVCIRMGEARREGDLIACVPNHLVIRVEGDDTEEPREYDLLSR